MRSNPFSKSLHRQVAVSILILLMGTIVAAWVINTGFLGTFYTIKKQQQLVEFFNEIQIANENDKLETDEFDTQFEKMCATGNVMMLVFESDGKVVLSSSPDYNYMIAQYMDILFGGGNTSVIKQTDNYSLAKSVDGHSNIEYLTLYGTLPDNKLVLLRTALEGIHDSVTIANRFLLYIGIAVILIGACVGNAISRKIAEPIKKLTEISASMVDLNFEVKYHHHATYEIDQLGSNMNALSEKLEQTISELKTANLELQRDIERKIQVEEMRKEFLSNVSHELKTPLALIQGYAEGLQECINDDPESRDFYCEVIIDEAEKMNIMVKKLLTLNQLEFGDEQVTMERFDMTELIHGMLKNMELLLGQKEISVSFSEKDPVYVWADEFKVEEVMTNFLSNAMNHIDGERHIRVFYTRKEDILRVSVYNTGKQIPQEDLEKIWQKFYKVDKAHTREYGGNGIGLSIVKAIMDSFGRECGVLNHDDGVEFWMELETR